MVRSRPALTRTRLLERLESSMPFFGVSKASALLIILIAVLAAPLAQTSGRYAPVDESASAQQEKNARSTSDTNSSDYAGAESCKACHEDIYNGWEKGPHWKATVKANGGTSHRGCEACHGAAASHVAEPSDTSKRFLVTKASVEESNVRALTCHAGGSQHMNAINSIHSLNDVSCISCHSPHHAEAKEFLLAKAQPQLCYSCHLQQKPQFEMPFHHRVNEGLIQCTDCHNPHGTVKPKQVRTSATQDVICYECHTDKQGPFVFEHEAVKVEGCSSCHSVHGSPNAHMMKVSNVNIL